MGYLGYWERKYEHRYWLIVLQYGLIYVVTGWFRIRHVYQIFPKSACWHPFEHWLQTVEKCRRQRDENRFSCCYIISP